MAAKNESNKLAKECMVTALVQLMKKRPYHSITITDITRRAGVSRMAYYRNYSSKEDILNKYMEEVAETVHAMLQAHRDRNEIYHYFEALFEQLGQYNDVGKAVLHARLDDLILSNINKTFFKSFPPTNDTNRYRLYFFAGAFYNVFVEWLRGGQLESCAEMARICTDLTENGCLDVFKRKDGENGQA